NKEGYLFGFTDNYIKIKIPFQSTICRTKKQARLIAIDDDGIMKAEIA
ncbi:MAG: tRNA (N(6)-L-threonylcarbamoyladenosine(37)-C(2))-methylthiotransferase MtaB, partial [Flavobacteriales bacterium]|nr:tRNA (N(6)-L-threonylcarbamoyladenosine(37)-C(2))-methylthiotransferase MtaB [Flavobacteriales bacterium]